MKSTLSNTKRTQPQNILNLLRAAIVSGDGELLQDGRLLPERQLSHILGVGRASVRKALSRLEEEGFLYRRQGQGTFAGGPQPRAPHVASISNRTSPADIMEVRRVIEPQLARLAALRATPTDIRKICDLAERGLEATTGPKYERCDSNFHRRLAQSARNSLFVDLFELISSVRTAQRWSDMRASTFSESLRDELTRQHISIGNAIKLRDPDLSERLMLEHIDFVATVVGA